MNLGTLLNVLPIVGPLVARAPEFVALMNEVIKTLKPADQKAAQDALRAVQLDNDEGHVRLQRKLTELSAPSARTQSRRML